MMTFATLSYLADSIVPSIPYEPNIEPKQSVGELIEGNFTSPDVASSSTASFAQDTLEPKTVAFNLTKCKFNIVIVAVTMSEYEPR